MRKFVFVMFSLLIFLPAISFAYKSDIWIDGVQLESSVSSGNEGYFAYYSADGTVVDDQTVLYTNGTNVGIGTSTTTGLLTIYDGDSNSGAIVMDDLDGDRTYTHPNKSGTYAMLDDIPTISVDCSAYSAAWNGVTGDAPCEDSVYDMNVVTLAEDGITETGAVVHLETSTGEVAIGTTTAAAKLTVDGDDTAQVTTLIQMAGSQTADGFVVEDSAGNDKFAIQADGDLVGGDGATGSIAINTYKLNAAVADDTFAGMTISLTAGETLALGNVGYMKSDGKVWKADANGVATMPGLFIATAAISADAAGVFGVHGLLRDDSAYAWTVGARLYTSGTAGALTETRPGAANDVSCVPAIALNADTIYFVGNCIAEVVDSTT